MILQLLFHHEELEGALRVWLTSRLKQAKRSQNEVGMPELPWYTEEEDTQRL